MTDSERGQVRTCYRCGRERPLDAFTHPLEDRHYNICRPCVSEILLKGNGKRERLQHTVTHRTCYLCRRVLPNESFTQRSSGTYFSACKDCNRNVFAQRRRARKQNADGSFTTTEWEALLGEYDRCPMCVRRWEDIEPHSAGGYVVTRDHIVPLARAGPTALITSSRSATPATPGRAL